MKSMKYILGTIAAMAGMSLASCMGDLDVSPIDPQMETPDKALTDEASFTSFLAGIYTGYATSGYYGPSGDPSLSGLDGGASQYIRGLFHLNELTTDEAVCNWNDQTIRNFHAMNWSSDDTFIYAIYCRFLYQISLCNEFIRQANSSSVEFSDKQEMIDEARVMRALSYLHAIDNFGNVPFTDETSSVGSTAPERITRADLYAWLETELTDLVENSALPAAKSPKAYGRVDKGVAKMILAKLYLNAEVYSGTAQWDKCASVLLDLADDGYSLHGDYSELFLADNDKCTDEIIWAIEQDGINTQSYGVTNYIIFANTGDGMDAAEMGISSGWGGIRATDAFYQKFDATDARKIFSDDEFHVGAITDVTLFTAGGHPSMKFKNINSDGTAGKAAGFVDTDFPVFRYADVLLMLAECALNGASNVSATQGLAYLNQVRERAGLKDADALTAQDIIDERGRELYHECWRRSDLIRFGLFTGTDYLWDWKGGSQNGQATDSYRTLFPIPASDLNANANLVQNPGY